MLGRTLGRFIHDDSGATAMEYALIAALIAVSVIGAMMFTSGSMSNMFNMVSNTSNNALSAASNAL